MQMRSSDAAGGAATKIDRSSARGLNPLIGISQKDTVSLVANFLRNMSDSDAQPLVVSLMSSMAASALEYEGD